MLAFAPDADPYAIGETPLPPYIRRDAARPEDAPRYQTVYARVPGSVAAPTAGLHLSEALLARLVARGVELADLVLHVGPGTFRPLSPAQLASGRLHARGVRAAGRDGRAHRGRARARRARASRSARPARACSRRAPRPDGRVEPGRGRDAISSCAPARASGSSTRLLTNFHLPRSSLLLLVAAFAGRERVLAAYAEAIRAGYRFYSYGDAMLVL